MVVAPVACTPAIIFLGAIFPLPNFFIWIGFGMVFGFFLPKIGIGLGTILAAIGFIVTLICGISYLGLEQSPFVSFLAAFVVGGPFFLGAAGRIALEFLGLGKFLP